MIMGVRDEKAGYNSKTGPIIPHLEIMMTCPDHQDFRCQNKVVRRLLIYSDHQDFRDVSRRQVRWSKYARDICVSLLPAGTPDPKAKGTLVIIYHKTQDNRYSVQGLVITPSSCMS